MLTTSTIQHNTPTMSKKIALYNSLVAFYQSIVTLPDYTFNEGQQKALDAIDEFENGNHHVGNRFDLSKCTALNADIVVSHTPMHHRKANLYKALVAFFESTLAKSDLTEQEEDEVSFILETNFPKDAVFGVIISTPCVARYDAISVRCEERREEREERQRVKTRKLIITFNGNEDEFDDFTDMLDDYNCEWEYA